MYQYEKNKDYDNDVLNKIKQEDWSNYWWSCYREINDEYVWTFDKDNRPEQCFVSRKEKKFNKYSNNGISLLKIWDNHA